MENLYAVLQCPEDATHEQLKQQFIKLARQHHPDKQQHQQQKQHQEHQHQEHQHQEHQHQEHQHQEQQQKHQEHQYEGHQKHQEHQNQGHQHHQHKHQDQQHPVHQQHHQKLEHQKLEHQKPAEASQPSHHMFAKISHAWKVLGDSELRKHFDVRWKDKCLAQDWPIQDTVDVEDFSPEEEDDSRMYVCRCGGTYSLTSQDVRLRFDVVCCDTCSLCIRVDYGSNDDDSAS